MAENNYNQMTDEQLVAFIANAVVAFTGEGSPTPYGLTTGQVTALTNAGTSLNAKTATAVSTEAAFRAAIQDKLAGRQTALENIGLCAGLMYATPGVTDTMVAAAGFQPHDTSRTPRLPFEPTDFVAAPNANGTVFLSWNRNGSAYGVDFVIETSSDGTTWNSFEVTKRKSVTLEGFAPGVTKYFRVKAVNRGISSVYSSVVPIYAPGAPPLELQVAA